MTTIYEERHQQLLDALELADAEGRRWSRQNVFGPVYDLATNKEIGLTGGVCLCALAYEAWGLDEYGTIREIFDRQAAWIERGDPDEDEPEAQVYAALADEGISAPYLYGLNDAVKDTERPWRAIRDVLAQRSPCDYQ